VDGSQGVKSVEKFGWGDQTKKVLATLKNREARYYLVVTDINGDQVSIEIEDPRQITLRSGTSKRPNATNVKLPIVALEVEVPGEPPIEILGESTGTMYVEANAPKPQPKVTITADTRDAFDDLREARELFEKVAYPLRVFNDDPTSPTYYPRETTIPEPPSLEPRVDVYYDDAQRVWVHKTTWNIGRVNQTCYVKKITDEQMRANRGYWVASLKRRDYGYGPVDNTVPPPE
jgi:hypothetical protein